MVMEIAHTPVMQTEILDFLKPRGPRELMVDATVGEGGHAEMFLSRYPDLTIAAVDADPEILEVARTRLSPFGNRVRFFNTWFNLFFKDYPAELKRPDTVLFDLGISTFHYELSHRGFSFRKDEPLDMRLSADLELSAADVVNTYPEPELAEMLYRFGEERYSRRIARAIVERRDVAPFSTSAELADLITRAVPAEYRRGRLNPATRSFQALRIAVNGELPRLESGLESAMKQLNIGGRIAVVSFHSLEDRRVKQFLREKNKASLRPEDQPMYNNEGRRVVEILTRKPVVPGPQERAANPPSRSAKLRVAVKLSEEA